MGGGIYKAFNRKFEKEGAHSKRRTMPEQMHDMTKDKYPLHRELPQVNKKKQTLQLKKKLAVQRRNTNGLEKGTEK